MPTNKKHSEKLSYVWALVRILIGIVFLWAFMDKMLGLGYATCRSVNAETKEETVKVLCDESVVKGGSPTEGFLKFGTSGPFKDFYAGMAGNAIVDFLFMAGLGLIGSALILGIGVKVSVFSGALLLMMMWSAVLPGENNPLVDDHIIYSVALFGVLFDRKNQKWGLGKWWQKQPIVKRYPILA